MTRPEEQSPVAPVFAAEWGRLVAGLIAWCGDWELAEDGAQEAFARAVERWPVSGMPERPAAWLATVARNAIRDRLRRSDTERRRLTLATADASVAVDLDWADAEDIPDERLRLIFTCCHPALAMPARVALTLRTLAGLTTAEIARAFLVTEPTMTKRLVRARAKIRGAGIPYQVPSADRLPERLPGVLAVLYLLFNEGYAASSGDQLHRVDLTREAIRLTRQLRSLLPDPEVTGLLALLLLTDSRRAARVRNGHVIPLAEQDRASWDRGQIEEALSLLDGVGGTPGPYRVQALIGAVHAQALTAADTDWARIAGLYQLLPATPVTELNRAVAVSMAVGPAAALDIVDAVAEPLAAYHLLHATRADLMTRLGRTADARASLERAIELAPTTPERRLLRTRLAALTD
ncbi:RNA polymerase sigma factor [Flexivirga caeni]|uniref:Sigma-70 family RNA polymerase sigma factor n=1 Tax=Flexivirga caeni TaxID=2294115 RepID=A0A3M9M6X9_9MICO|nr:sigma-70 family RNA polymerase sigma factor [Flexivirga caeni]RNI21329.1 sigma-70 family RNA polymerase sigma factor [Flexivirga caeni]